MKTILIDENFNPNDLPEDLRPLYEAYLKNSEKKTTFANILAKRYKSEENYLDSCANLAKSVKFVSFNRIKKSFEVRIVHNGERFRCGTSHDFDEACDMLKVFLEAKLSPDAV